MTIPGRVSTVMLEAALGTMITVPFRFRRKGTILNWNVTSAEKIILEANKVGEPATFPVMASPSYPGADWANGLVPFLLSPADVTAQIGTYNFLVTVYKGSEVRAAVTGMIEVLPRPVYNPVDLPGSGSYMSTGLLADFNVSETVTILRGQPVGNVVGGIALASSAAGSSLRCSGIALANISPKTYGLYMTTGSLSLPDWSAITGTPTLADTVSVYLGITPGTLTDVLPSAPTSDLLQLVGQGAGGGSRLDLQLGTYEVDL